MQKNSVQKLFKNYLTTAEIRAIMGLVKYENVCSNGVAVSLGSNTERCAGSSPVIRTMFRRHNGDISYLTLVKSIPIYRGVFLFILLSSRIYFMISSHLYLGSLM